MFCFDMNFFDDSALNFKNQFIMVFFFQDQGLTTPWDDQLSYILTPALAAYETERVTGNCSFYTVREPAVKDNSGRKIPCRTGVSSVLA